MFLIVMVTIQAMLIIGTSTMSLITCCKNNDVSEKEDTKEAKESPVSSDSSSKSKSSEVEIKPPPIIPDMAADNANVKYVLEFNGPATQEFLNNVNMVVVSANSWLWAAKKRATASSAAWKDIAKRITILQTEGFDVLPGSDEAKQLRKVLSQKNPKTALMDKVAPKKEKKKKKKKEKENQDEDD